MKWFINSATLFLLTAAFLPLSNLACGDDGSERPGLSMATAATKLVEVLPAEFKQKMMFSYDDPERLNWHFIPAIAKVWSCGIYLANLAKRLTNS